MRLFKYDLNFPKENRVPTGMLLTPIGSPAPRDFTTLDTSHVFSELNNSTTYKWNPYFENEKTLPFLSCVQVEFVAFLFLLYLSLFLYEPTIHLTTSAVYIVNLSSLCLRNNNYCILIFCVSSASKSRISAMQVSRTAKTASLDKSASTGTVFVLNGIRHCQSSLPIFAG